MGIACHPGLHRHSPVCRCGRAVTRDDIIHTTTGAYYICQTCWESGRRRWFRPDTKAERLRAVEAVERGDYAA